MRPARIVAAGNVDLELGRLERVEHRQLRAMHARAGSFGLEVTEGLRGGEPALEGDLLPLREALRGLAARLRGRQIDRALELEDELCGARGLRGWNFLCARARREHGEQPEGEERAPRRSAHANSASTMV
ncbi:MAG: hypothetical protein IPN34_10930 [Planctomycetes bacterium]|nr:hypothetical protein [Planctomycetota bacterium]